MLTKRLSCIVVRSFPRFLPIRYQSSEFVAPERPVLKSKDDITKKPAVEVGLSEKIRKIFSSS